MKKALNIVAILCATLALSCGQEEGIRMGSLSGDMDSLSYAMGVNAGGYLMNYNDIPLDFKALESGLADGALEKSTVTREENIEKLREYFMNHKPERSRNIAAKRAEADSIRLAAGDTTKVEYPVADPEMFVSEEERHDISYALGVDMGMSLLHSPAPLQIVWMQKGMQDVRDENALMSQEDAYAYLNNYFMVIVPMKNAEKSKEWLEKIEKKSGVQKTESGLLYKITEAGDPTCIAVDSRDVVKVHYTGRTRDGKVFDSSIFKNRPKEQQEIIKKQRPNDFDQDQPVEFPLNRVISGWTEGMKLVGKGGHITLWIPAELAYGARGNGSIGPNEALEFEVEVIDVTPYEEPKPAAEEPAAEAPAAEE